MAGVGWFGRVVFLAGLAAVWLAGPAAARFETRAPQALLMDFDTGAVLFAKDAGAIMFPASMTKIMTAYILFEELASGRLAMDDTLPVSEKAWRTGGSKMFVEVGKTVRVDDILRGIIVQSGNDASIVAAEAIAGSESAFSERMTETARRLGMTDTVFRNATGWPDPDHYSTARDIAVLSRRIITDFPDYYPLFAEKEYTFAGIKQGNRNPLLYTDIGADGLKTGHTEASGYGLAASAARDGRRLVMVINGLASSRERSQEADRLMRRGFREFENVTLFPAGEPVAAAETWLGSIPAVPLVLAEPLTVTLPRGGGDKIEIKAVYQGPIPAPITAGTAVATLVITGAGTEPVEKPLLAAVDVERPGPLGRLTRALGYLVFGGG